MLQVVAADVMILLMHFHQVREVPKTEQATAEDPQAAAQCRQLMAEQTEAVVVVVPVTLLQIHLDPAALE
jgi:hypothetical protein